MFDRINGLRGWLYVLTALTIPLSVKVYILEWDLEVITPAEPLIGLLFMLALVDLLFRSGARGLGRAVRSHPITLLVLGYVLVSAIATLGSSMPLVSAKAFLVRVAFITVFYFAPLAAAYDRRIKAPFLMRAYGSAFVLVVLFTLGHHLQKGLTRSSAGYVSFPFYTDHTIYSAALVFVLCFTTFFALRAGRTGILRWPGNIFALTTVLLLIALYFSYCRAAWLSLMVCVVGAVLFRLSERKRFYSIAAASVFLVGAFSIWSWSARGPGTNDPRMDGAGVSEVLNSMTNTTTDLSNRERLNRWSCAYRMFKDHPFLGIGPGTYQFKYVPYQLPEERTLYSVVPGLPDSLITRAWTLSERLMVRDNPQIFHYSGGTAHSEYFLALSEAGIFELLFLMGLFSVPLIIGMRALVSSADQEKRAMLSAALLALFAYAVHAAFNNYLDDPKIAVLFWTVLRYITTCDLERHAGGMPEGGSSLN